MKFRILTSEFVVYEAVKCQNGTWILTRVIGTCNCIRVYRRETFSDKHSIHIITKTFDVKDDMCFVNSEKL